jgi:hypothetical protein
VFRENLHSKIQPSNQCFDPPTLIHVLQLSNHPKSKISSLWRDGDSGAKHSKINKIQIPKSEIQISKVQFEDQRVGILH